MQETQLAFDLDRLVADCVVIAREEAGGIIRSKWAMGNRILREFALVDPETGNRKRIQKGAYEAIEQELQAILGDGHGYGYETLRKCVRFAKRIPEEELGNVITEFKTWYNIAGGNGNGAHVGHNSGVSEWFTKPEIVEAAREVMGGIDLDPASTAIANEKIQATRFHSVEDDGLSQEWAGRVWMNPPYAQPVCADFTNKLLRHYNAGDVTEACVLVNNATETEWLQALAAVATAACFPRTRAWFWHPERESAPLQGQVVLYLGPSPLTFRNAFEGFGFTAEL